MNRKILLITILIIQLISLISCTHEETIDPFEKQLTSCQWINYLKTTDDDDRYQLIPSLSRKVVQLKTTRKYFIKSLDWDGDTIVFSGRWMLDKKTMVLDFVDLDTAYFIKKRNQSPYYKEIPTDWKIQEINGDSLKIKTKISDDATVTKMILMSNRAVLIKF